MKLGCLTMLAITCFASTFVRGEVPAKTPTGWNLAHVPVSGVSCYRNGLRQSPVQFKDAKGATVFQDYTLRGSAITSSFWRVGDSLLCDYEW